MDANRLSPVVLAVALVALSIAVATPARAECEREQGEYDRFHKLCDKYSGCSQAFSFTIIGGLACGAVANNQCRIRDEKLNNLRRCREDAAQRQRAAAEAAAAAAAEAARQAEEKQRELDKQKLEAERKADLVAKLQLVNDKYRDRALEKKAAMQKSLDDFAASLDSVSNKKELAEKVAVKRQELESQLAVELSALEQERLREVAQVESEVSPAVPGSPAVAPTAK